MTGIEVLEKNCENKRSNLCLGLDPSLEKMPVHLSEKGVDGIKDFCLEIIDSTIDIVAGYKINFAFFEQHGVDGYAILKILFDYLNEKRTYVIADAKRGDIGNTSKSYARSLFDYFKADSITVSPYMGEDSIRPFLDYKNKLTFILGLTSNPGSKDLQALNVSSQRVYEVVVSRSLEWSSGNLGFVVGATKSPQISSLRDIAPSSPFLIPGIGSQGGSLEETVKNNRGGSFLINSSRSIIYASKEKGFAEVSRKKTIELNDSINRENARN